MSAVPATSGSRNVQDDLGVLRIILVPAVVQSLSRSRQTDGGHELEVEPGLSEMVSQDTVIIAGRFKPIRTGGS